MELAELSKLVDEYHAAREERLAADRHAKRLKSTETNLKDGIIQELISNDVRIASGLGISVKLQRKEKLQASDWSAVHKYMVENDAMDLVQKRLNEGAVKLRREDGVKVPGVESYEVLDLSISKI